MDKKTIEDNYAVFSTEKLIEIALDIKSLNPEFIPVLQKELIKRNELEVALGMTAYLTSIKYHVTESVLFDNILSYRKVGITEAEINTKLKEEHGIDSNYAKLIRISLKEKGKENIAIGTAMVIIPLFLGITLLIMRTFIGVLPLLLIGIGIWRLNKGIMQKRENN